MKALIILSVFAAFIMFLIPHAAAWDSDSWMNPTHPTHNYFTEYAVDQLKAAYPEVQQYSAALIKGANVELHELPITTNLYGINFEDKRAKVYEGTNVGCKHPELIWKDSLDAYKSGNKEQAYAYLGVLLHEIQDMGLPVHAHDIYHQGNATEFDNMEFMAVFNWKPDYQNINKQPPALKYPYEYYEFSKKWTLEDAPNYTSRDQFSKTWTLASDAERALLSNRQGRTAFLTKWAVECALKSFGLKPSVTAGTSTGSTSGTTSTGSTGTASASSGTKATEKKSAPSFSLLAAYNMKTVRRSGKFEIDFNKFTTDTLHLRFDENIGDLSSLMNDPKHFMEVNLDDPVFKQREISVFLDGQNATDFASFVNYVTVRLRKKHEGGDQTDDEVRIDRTSFSNNGNYFKLLYGWKNDRDRNRWMGYEYDAVWSFHGGMEVDMGWKKANTFALTVTPPYLKRTIHLEADPALLNAADVRLITVDFYYDVAGKEQTKQISINPTKDPLSQTFNYIRPADQLQYAYQITWWLKGGQTITTGKKTSSDDYIFLDEIPAN